MTDINSTRVRAPDTIGADCQSAQDRAFTRDGGSQPKVEQGAPKADFQSVTHFATWNVITLNGLGYQVVLVNELAKYNIAAAGISEARLPGHEQRTVNSATMLLSGSKDHTQGVVLVLHPLLRDSLVMWHPISP